MREGIGKGESNGHIHSDDQFRDSGEFKVGRSEVTTLQWGTNNGEGHIVRRRPETHSTIYLIHLGCCNAPTGERGKREAELEHGEVTWGT